MEAAKSSIAPGISARCTAQAVGPISLQLLQRLRSSGRKIRWIRSDRAERR